MEYHQYPNKKRTTKMGWGILLIMSTLLMVVGTNWFFAGPNIIHARLVAVWYISFGMQALLVALEGYRNGTRWAWYSSWALVVALAAIGLVEVTMDSSAFFGLILLGFAGMTIIGLLLARINLS